MMAPLVERTASSGSRAPIQSPGARSVLTSVITPSNGAVRVSRARAAEAAAASAKAVSRWQAITGALSRKLGSKSTEANS
jgi:hypothetical protein